MPFSLSIFFTGFFTGAALIIAIGAQNAFVLRQGIRREHVFAVALICSIADAVLIALGVGGVGTVVQQSPLLLKIATYGGAAFLIGYGFKAARRALAQTDAALEAGGSRAPAALYPTIMACLAFTVLNPHVYLDTVLLVGSLSAHYPSHGRWIFGFGAMSASVVWFFGLAYGARLLAPLFRKPNAWRVLDAIIAVVMFSIAGSLLLG